MGEPRRTREHFFTHAEMVEWVSEFSMRYHCQFTKNQQDTLVAHLLPRLNKKVSDSTEFQTPEKPTTSTEAHQ